VCQVRVHGVPKGVSVSCTIVSAAWKVATLAPGLTLPLPDAGEMRARPHAAKEAQQMAGDGMEPHTNASSRSI